MFGEGNSIQDQKPNQFHCYNQNTGFVNRMAQDVAKYKIEIRMKNGGGPRLFEW